MKEKLISLNAGALGVALAPEAGGSIARFTVERGGKAIDLMRPAPDTALAANDSHGMAGFPMIPFCGRIAQARFAFGGETFALNRNFGDTPHAIHGNAWQRTWRVAASALDRAELVLEHDPAGHAQEWPFAYTARQVFTLTAEGLQVAIDVTSRDRRAMPLGFGLHPYFPMTPEARITARVGMMWENDETMQPTRQVAVPKHIDFADGRRVAELAVDNCFSGWTQPAEIAWPEHGLALRIEADPVFGHFVVYTPPHRQYFCAEPQTVAPDAVNLAARGVEGTGLITLAPGATQRGTVRFVVRDV
jgi:aldose 1-epimerase